MHDSIGVEILDCRADLFGECSRCICFESFDEFEFRLVESFVQIFIGCVLAEEIDVVLV